MLDYRIDTFLRLCEVLNYRVTAEQLNMTQPAVTQHIHYLEKEYKAKLFIYKNHRLIMTDAARKLESYARSAVHNELTLRNELAVPETTEINIGATKSIGGYDISEQVADIISRNDLNLLVYVDNTENLLKMLDNSKIDIALIEGFFDKEKYSSELYKKVPFVGICSCNHRFAGREVSFEELLEESLIVREKGSGTRAVLEQIICENNYSLKSFRKVSVISSFELIKNLVSENLGISFVYDVVTNGTKNLSTFKIKDTEIVREFNFVYLKNTEAEKIIELFK